MSISPLAPPDAPSEPVPQRSYLLAALLFLAAVGFMYVGDRFLLRFGFPWALVCLLAVAAAGSLWGVRPALVVLALSALFGEFIVPDLHLAYLTGQDLSWHVRVTRVLLFTACGGATIWLTYRARLLQEKADRRKTVVQALQHMISPDRLVDVPGYDLSGAYHPARQEEEVGGDFYDVYPIRPGVYGLLIGDVMGKGKEAAAYTALLRYSVRAFISAAESPAQALRQLNEMIERQGLDFETASLFAGVLDVSRNSLLFASAGHEPPLLRRVDGGEEMLDATGPILGVTGRVTYGEQSVILEPGDALLLMTDGVTEARNAQGRFLETEGAWRLLHAALTAPTAAEALASLEESVLSFIGRNSRDDIALILLRRLADKTQGQPLLSEALLDRETAWKG